MKSGSCGNSKGVVDLPLQQKRFAQVSIGLFLLFVIFVIGDALFEHYFDHSHNITPMFHNVYQDRLGREWDHLRGILHMNADSVLLDFHADYKPTGEVTEVNWEFGEPIKANEYKVYDIWLPPESKSYQVNISNQNRYLFGPDLKATEFNRLLTPELWKSMTPHEQASSFRLQFNPQYVQNLPAVTTNFLDITDRRITSHTHKSSGYTLDLSSFYQQSPNSYVEHSGNRYLLVYPQ